MALSEFQLIDKYLTGIGQASGVALGIGDDAALLEPVPGQQLVVAADTLVEGVHFPVNCDPGHVGYRALAVNLSDLAAMAATPRWFTLCLTLPEADEHWIAGFARGLAEAADLGGIALVGGDTTRGPLSVSIQVMGTVDADKALRRSGAGVGDNIIVCGSLGASRAGLEVINDRTAADSLLQAYYRPRPLLDESLRIAGLASSCIDVSDGLLADLGHICTASGVGARLNLNTLPIAPEVQKTFPQQAQAWALSGGDDYALCFTVPANAMAALDSTLAGSDYSVVGEIVEGSGVVCLDEQGNAVSQAAGGYDHFKPA